MSFSGYPQSATNAAKRALKFKKDNGSSCGTPVGWQRANQLASREALSLKTVKRTFSFLSRAEVYDQGRFTDKDGKQICGSIMYAAWGGKAMRGWCNKIIVQEDARAVLNEQAQATLKNERFRGGKHDTDLFPKGHKLSSRSMEDKKEIRTSTGLEVRYVNNDNEDKRTLTGYAIKFGDVTTIGDQFREQVNSRALEGVDMSNTFALFNHDWSTPLGRAGRNMDLTIDDTGLRVDIELPETTAARDLSELVKNDIVGGMSFGFTIADDTWTRNDEEMPLRTINQIERLYEVTFTPVPAYPTTEVALRSMEAATTEEDTKEILQEINGDPVEAQTTSPSSQQEEQDTEPTTVPQNASEDKPLAFTKVDALKFLLDHQK